MFSVTLFDNGESRSLFSCLVISYRIKISSGSWRLATASLCIGQFQNRPSPPPWANPGACDFFEKFWLNYPLDCQFKPSNAPPIRASKRVKSSTLQACEATVETSSAKFSATTNFLFSLSSLHNLNRDKFHDITVYIITKSMCTLWLVN